MEVANRVWSGRVRVLEETNNEAMERKQSRPEMQGQQGQQGQQQGQERLESHSAKARERGGWMEGVRFLEHLPEAIMLAVARDLKTVRFCTWERSLLDRRTAASRRGMRLLSGLISAREPDIEVLS